jgi:transcriptional regulator with XRE-family HTH domain
MGAKPGNYRAAQTEVGSFDRTAAEVLRALRGRRSQRAFARRLGYRANPITDWEHGRRFPTGVETLRAAHLVGVDVTRAFVAFHVAPPPAKVTGGRFAIAPWLTAIRGTTPVAHVAERAGCSRFAMARWLSGAAQPRLPDFLRCVDAITGRLPDLVASLVEIDQVPSLAARYRAMRAARRLAFDAPWTELVLRVLEIDDYRALASHDDAFAAERLGVSVEVVRDALERLEGAGVIRLENGRFCQERPLTVNTRGARDDVNVLLGHWSAVGARRAVQRKPRDFFAYNALSCSRADYDQIRVLLRRTFREVQSIVAASQPTERVALLNLQLLEFE